MEFDMGVSSCSGSAPRALKRAFTTYGEHRMQSQEARTPPPVNRVVFPSYSPMDSALMPPPKRVTRIKSSISSTLFAAPPCSPTRVLTPRVSWSEIVSHSQESLIDRPLSPPRTPMSHGLAPPSPPQRCQTLRHRPPSFDRMDAMDVLGERDENEGRFMRDFCEVTKIGKGQFSTVYQARNKVDHCLYAIKKTNQISRGEPSQGQLREVLALASLAIETDGCPHIVRYFSSWFEDGRLHIQTELCEMSLRDRLTQLSRDWKTGGKSCPRMESDELSHILLHVAKGLNVLHMRNYVHLDIKPDNILVARDCYKIADLGLAAAAIGSGCDDVSEGDCRYLSRDVLQGDLSNLPKADVFALGLACYELATNPYPLPMQGEEWQQLRKGVLNDSRISPSMPGELLALFRSMVQEPATQRPSCDEILRHPSVAPSNGHHALQEKMKQAKLEAEEAKQRAEEYFREMLAMKRQELMGCSASAPPRLVVDDDCLRATGVVPVMHRAQSV